MALVFEVPGQLAHGGGFARAQETADHDIPRFAVAVGRRCHSVVKPLKCAGGTYARGRIQTPTDASAMFGLLWNPVKAEAAAAALKHVSAAFYPFFEGCRTLHD